MNNEQKKIYNDFDGKLVGSLKMKKNVCFIVSKLPVKLQEFITKNCWFVSSMEDAYGFVLRGDDLKNKYLIFLSDDLFNDSSKQIYHTIVHEIGHVILKHENSILRMQTKFEIKRQEEEADEFARTMLLTLGL